MEYLGYIVDFFYWWVMIAGSASLILKAFEKLAQSTETKLDDKIVGKGKVIIDFLNQIAHAIALSPKGSSKKKED